MKESLLCFRKLGDRDRAGRSRQRKSKIAINGPQWAVILQPGKEENRFPSRSFFSSVSSKWMDICSYRHLIGRHFHHKSQEVQQVFPFSNLFSCFPKSVKKVGRLWGFCYRDLPLQLFLLCNTDD